MTIVMSIRVPPYKATHFENRKSILHFMAFMVSHKRERERTLFATQMNMSIIQL